jgi:CheY-like chemotaxis protein
MQQTNGSKHIFIVDDILNNLILLEELLKSYGYKVSAFLNASLCLDAVEAGVPDMFVLDITMPKMTGSELCRRLKTNPKTKDIPVIFISALTGTREKIEAFDCGGIV